jgi:ankyrin repeat protein
LIFTHDVIDPDRHGWTPLHACVVGWAEMLCGLRVKYGGGSRSASSLANASTVTLKYNKKLPACNKKQDSQDIKSLLAALGCEKRKELNDKDPTGLVTYQACLFPQTMKALLQVGNNCFGQCLADL